MANEKANAKATAKTQKRLVLERDSFPGNDGKEYWSYCIKGKFLGRDTKADFVASDQGGYEVLDLLFSLAEKRKSQVELVMHDETMTDENGKENQYTVYEAQIKDDEGNLYSYKIKPARNSDKSLLQFLLIDLNKEEA